MQPISPRSYVSRNVEVAPTIDGVLNDEAWALASWTEDFVDIEGASKPKPKYRTRAKVVWDNNNLYFAAELEEPHVWGTLTKHDSVIFHDPDFEVFIDPDGDSHNYFEFEMNALNTGWDLMLPKPYKDGGKADDSWEIPGLQTAVGVRGTLNDPADLDEGWCLEIAIPWSALTTNANQQTRPCIGDQWRLGFSRVQWQINADGGTYRKVPMTPESNWVWSPQGVIDMHRPERWGYLNFSGAKLAEFAPDPAASVRDSLQGVYYAQRAFRKQHGRWAQTLDELGRFKAAGSTLSPTLRSTVEGWEAKLDFLLPSGIPQQWDIAHDARIWCSSKP